MNSNRIQLGPHSPEVEENVFIADNARVIGSVKLKSDSSVWFGAVLRGDTEPIQVGIGTNIQDNATIHTDPGFPVVLGDHCIIGHNAVVHGARLANHVLIGMHATVLNGAEIGEFSIIGANALVTSNTIIPPRSIVMGVPGKVVGQVDEAAMDRIRENARVYVERAQQYLL
ncbi:MAG: gamma carbonic anhydrase family protein [Bacteroidetes bacterium]|nr:gamma carbonic anhydrase family protein [Bacteroidota bacterium]